MTSLRLELEEGRYPPPQSGLFVFTFAALGKPRQTSYHRAHDPMLPAHKLIFVMLLLELKYGCKSVEILRVLAGDHFIEKTPENVWQHSVTALEKSKTKLSPSKKLSSQHSQGVSLKRCKLFHAAQHSVASGSQGVDLGFPCVLHTEHHIKSQGQGEGVLVGT